MEEKMEMTDETKNKLEIAQDLIRQLYKNNLITDAYIIGSVGRGVARKESDIDVNIINQYISKPYIGSDLDICVSSNEDPVMSSVTKFLLSIGVEFKFGINLKRKGVYSWSQIYKGEIFEIKIYDEFDYDGKIIRIENDRKNGQNRKNGKNNVRIIE